MCKEREISPGEVEELAASRELDLLQENMTTVATAFEYTAKDGVETVALAGDWEEWAGSVAMTCDKGNVWQVVTDVPIGDIKFKFVVDGEWVIGGPYDAVEDGFGGANHVRSIGPAVEEKGKSEGKHESDEAAVGDTPDVVKVDEERALGKAQVLEGASEQAPDAPENSQCVLC